jgi:hypothetical protein
VASDGAHNSAYGGARAGGDEGRANRMVEARGGGACRGTSGYDGTHSALTRGGGGSDSDDIVSKRGSHVEELGRCESSQRWTGTMQPG